MQAAELDIEPRDAEVRRASGWLAEQAGRMHIPPDVVQRLDLCLNEALANVFTHGGPTALSAPVRIRLERVDTDTGAEARMRLVDAGRPFDPSSAAIAPRPGSLDEAEPGGMGLLMIRGYADELQYRRKDRRNHLSFAVRWLV